MMRYPQLYETYAEKMGKENPSTLPPSGFAAFDPTPGILPTVKRLVYPVIGPL